MSCFKSKSIAEEFTDILFNQMKKIYSSNLDINNDIKIFDDCHSFKIQLKINNKA